MVRWQIDVNSELGLIHHTSHPHVCGKKVYNIGQKLGLWLGPHYVIVEMECAEKKPGAVGSNDSKTTGDTDTGEARNRKDGGRDRATSTSSAASFSEIFGKSSSEFSSGTPSDNNNKANTTPTTTGNLHKSQDPISGARGLKRETVAGSESEKGSSSPSSDWSPWSTAKILATIPSRWPLSICYMHSFSITQNYFILVEQPLSIFLPTVPINQLCGEKPIASCLRYYPEEDTLFHVISRHPGKSSGKDRRVFRAPSFFFLHTINAFEMRDVDTADTFIIVDICCYDDPAMIDCMYVDALKVQ